MATETQTITIPLPAVENLGVATTQLPHRVDIIPVGVAANQHDEPRKVYLTWRVAFGAIGQAIQGLLKDSSSNITQHWMIRVGDYEHELQADDDLEVFYQNHKNLALDVKTVLYLDAETTFNDRAIVQAADKVMAEMKATGKYGPINNNCQKFADKLAHAICPGKELKLPPSLDKHWDTVEIDWSKWQKPVDLLDAFPDGKINGEEATVQSSQVFMPVHWVPGTIWTATSPEVQALGISRYQLVDNGSSSYFRYTLGFTNTKGWGYSFRDESGDTYHVTTAKNNDHYVSFDSDKPIIVGVASD